MTRPQVFLIGGVIVFLGTAVVGTVFKQTHLLPLMALGGLLMALGAFAANRAKGDDDAR